MDKLQELTDRLFNEGLEKGKAEGEAVLQKAREEAAAILSDARKEADEIVAKARADADDLKAKVDSDLKMASAQCLQATKKDIENLVTLKLVSQGTGEALSDPGFLKETIKAVAANFNKDEAMDLALVLPESLQKDLEPFVKGELAKILGSGVQASFSKKISGGFTIGPADGSYFISLTDETFRELIGEYLRPVTKKLLFG